MIEAIQAIVDQDRWYRQEVRELRAQVADLQRRRVADIDYIQVSTECRALRDEVIALRAVLAKHRYR